ncbi:leucyl/phenylalanyl-tRNA--protein transferase [Pseudomonas sp. GX19020]|uniref:leucyl/phenylalanyl-tRNA--protein transferase n=1 Tax=Pseudomonas sp. GX19020 TaxID=2942277 RepID=UPI002019FD96|nr:leucyl/phenylalanyl-tRNA--protein transferase [Pseudomonas sp. GX19020]MCL4065113.1 leucyl/phenylalanyl-tRNA--protein transferase [Pseudomonas sp. GX19020]
MTATTPELLLHAYAAGVFPMADSRDDPEIHWVDPHRRGVLPLDGFHISRSLAKTIRRAPWRVSVNEAFRDVVLACADREETWINPQILALYQSLHEMGFAHSLEVWEDDALVGGVYGVSLGAAFFGESMFSRRTDASKLALAYLTHRLRAGGYLLLDTQFITPHLASLGGVEIPRAAYHERLRAALGRRASFLPTGYSPSPSSVSSGVSIVSGGL